MMDILDHLKTKSQFHDVEMLKRCINVEVANKTKPNFNKQLKIINK